MRPANHTALSTPLRTAAEASPRGARVQHSAAWFPGDRRNTQTSKAEQQPFPLLSRHWRSGRRGYRAQPVLVYMSPRRRHVRCEKVHPYPDLRLSLFWGPLNGFDVRRRTPPGLGDSLQTFSTTHRSCVGEPGRAFLVSASLLPYSGLLPWGWPRLPGLRGTWGSPPRLADSLVEGARGSPGWSVAARRKLLARDRGGRAARRGSMRYPPPPYPRRQPCGAAKATVSLSDPLSSPARRRFAADA